MSVYAVAISDSNSKKSETRRFPFELVYPLYFVEYNCTTSQGEYLYIKKSVSCGHPIAGMQRRSTLCGSTRLPAYQRYSCPPPENRIISPVPHMVYYLGAIYPLLPCSIICESTLSCIVSCYLFLCFKYFVLCITVLYLVKLSCPLPFIATLSCTLYRYPVLYLVNLPFPVPVF